MPNRRSAAYHEAAHAFFAELYGIGCQWLAIEDDGIEGHCRTNSRGLTRTRDEAFENSIISLAGIYAELRLRDGAVWADSVDNLVLEIGEAIEAYERGDIGPELFSEDILDFKEELDYLVGEGSRKEWYECIEE